MNKIKIIIPFSIKQQKKKTKQNRTIFSYTICGEKKKIKTTTKKSYASNLIRKRQITFT